MDITFELAKRFSKATQNAPGIALRSMKLENGVASVLVLADKYDDIRKRAEAYRMLTNRNIGCRMRGKSLEIYSSAENPLSVVFDFASEIGFASDEVLEFIDFYNKNVGLDPRRFKPAGIELNTEEAHLFLTTSICSEEERRPLYDVVASLIEDYNMGLVKETPGSVD